MRADRRMIALHGSAAVLTLVAALVWPRAGQAALLVPLAGNDLGTVLRWADSQSAPLLALDTTNGRVIARISSNRSLLSAVGSGIVPIAARNPDCRF